MTSSDIRKKFLDFFKSKGHAIVPSAPIVVKNDPTLMFTNAGMNQFKDMFLGTLAPKDDRVADTQKCLRVSGKHNDLEEVGVDTYHHTMFEMLGNWSFGDYFKKEAISFAWELLTEVYQIDKEKLYITVFKGDQADNLEADQESVAFWKDLIPAERILYFDRKDNFWEMGDTGPCGPCSEIHVDLRSDADRRAKPGAELVNMDHPEVIEIWNLVFIQYNRQKDNSLVELPNKHVDTGMGFERLCMVLQNKISSYDTDVFSPMIRKVEELSGIKYGADLKTDIAIRVVVDHIRAITFTIADGQLPSNTGAGYVIRRILRRAVRYYYNFLGRNEATLVYLVDILVDQFGAVFPEVKKQQSFIHKVVEEEEKGFLRTLESGLGRLDALLKQHRETLPGDVVFELYDTYGFPADLTRLIAGERGRSIDEKGFEKALQTQRERSRKAATSESGDWNVLAQSNEVTFTGYDSLLESTRILRHRTVKDKKSTCTQVVLEHTPFYAESGGQQGDKGTIEFDGKRLEVFDTKKENELIVQYIKGEPEIPTGEVAAIVNTKNRKLTCQNHSATHLLHAALKQVLGSHVEQRGSSLNAKHLRFDFSHFSKMTGEEINEVERLVNEKIFEGVELNEKRNVPKDDAFEMGATALFGEKYGDKVRMIIFDKDYSIELCGGTHVHKTSEIGLFKITHEAAIAAGIRRIEAVTGPEAVK
ncbi:MAG: alanine--tRNA ligase, partial [Bacteroidetes bacterium]|nr:alanine--tRNA ligase [Bacteroidota bacterium]